MLSLLLEGESNSAAASKGDACKGKVQVCCLFCLSFNSVQSFMIDICNKPPVKNGLHNVCLAPAVPYLYILLRKIDLSKSECED